MNDCCDPELALCGGASIDRQIETQIRDCIASGQLCPGEQLPTVRAMAVELAVNPSVVRKAYAQLEHEGFLNSEEGSGTFVAPQPPSELQSGDLWSDFQDLCHEFLAQAARYGFSSADVVDTIQALNPRRLSP